MEARAVLRYSGIPATKMRQVADLVRGKDLDVALHTLQSVTRAAALPLRKLIQSAAANARELATAADRRLDTDRLYIKSVAVDEGPSLKRWRPRAQGRAFRIRKRTCHVSIVLDEFEGEYVARRQAAVGKQASEAPEKSAKGRKGSKSAGGTKTVEAAK